MRFKLSGNTFFQYIIIIVLIALAIVPIFYFQGQTIFHYLENFSNSLNQNKTSSNSTQPVQSQNQTPLISAGELGGTSEKPVSKCNESTCTVDFGDFILQGIPENFNEHVQVGATSGGTHTIASLLDQIAKQLEEEGNDAGALQVKKLSNLGHNIAFLQKQLKTTIVEGCNDGYCVGPVLNSPFGFPPEFDNVLSNMKDSNYTHEEIINTTKIGTLRNLKMNNPDKFRQYLTNQDTGALFIEELDNIMENDSLSGSMKEVVKELAWSIGILAEENAYNCLHIYKDTSEQIIYKDPLTGKDYKQVEYFRYPKERFDAYNAPTITHFNSSLICASGRYKDTGKKCH